MTIEPRPTLVSFDIDETLEIGHPPGPLPLSLVLDAKARGYIIGSASDRVRSDQQRLWDTHGVEVDFVMHKHHLASLRERHPGARFIHIGDGPADEHYAKEAGFEFWFPQDLPTAGTPGWIF